MKKILLKLGLENIDVAIAMIPKLPEEEKLAIISSIRWVVTEQIRIGGVYNNKKALTIISYLDKVGVPLIEQEINFAVDTIAEFPRNIFMDDGWVELVSLAPDVVCKRVNEILSSSDNKERLSRVIEDSLLYKQGDDDSFRTKKFLKSGSGITLLGEMPRGESLVNKAIIRHISSVAYINWYDLYSNTKKWKEKGFDYVPVEPIFRVKAKGANADVVCGTLGPNISQWIAKRGPFLKEIMIQKDKIIETLNELGINHGHPHNSNFCLVFNKLPDGSPDISVPPLVYCIDFDEVESAKSLDE
jgi:hypothetical protein